MKTIAAIELVRKLREVLDTVARDGAEVLVERNRKSIAVLLPAPGRQIALAGETHTQS